MNKKKARRWLPDLATVAEVQQHLRLSRPTVVRLYSSGELRPIRIGRSVRFLLDDVRNLTLAQSKVNFMPKHKDSKRLARKGAE